jgi:hypothetical protein
MLDLNSERWSSLCGGYRVPFDPRPLLLKLEADQDTEATWHELWEELHHQGDVGEASYAAVPHLVRIHRERGLHEWNTYAIVATIDLARGNKKNPTLPRWLSNDYFDAIRKLAEIGATEVLTETNTDTVRAILAVLAISAGTRTHARFLLEYSADELLEIERVAQENL